MVIQDMLLAAAQPAALVGGLLLVGGIAALTLYEPSSAIPGPLRLDGKPVALVAASRPDIGPFEAYNVNQENPFVPYQERVQIKNKLNEKPVKVAPPPPPPPPDKKGPIVLTPPIPPLELPAIEASTGTRPLAFGVLSINGMTEIQVLMPGQTEPQILRPGDTAVGWTLRSVEHGSVVHFIAPDGREDIQVVGVGAAQGTEASAELIAAQSDQAPAAAKPGLANLAGGLKLPGGKIDLAQAQQLANWLSPQQIDAILARPDKDLILGQIANRLGGGLTPAQVEQLALQTRESKQAQQTSAQPPPPANAKKSTATHAPNGRPRPPGAGGTGR
jgi:hypothetical protein